MDALRNVMQALRLQAQLFKRWQPVAHWANRFSILNAAAFYAVERGTCWLTIQDTGVHIQLVAGDVVMISNCANYELSHPTDQPHSSDSTVLLHCEFRPERSMVYPLFSLLPPLIYIPNKDGKPVDWLAVPLQFITSESQTQYPAYEIVISHLLDVLLIMAIRYWIVHHTASEAGWLGGLYHPQLGMVLNQIHSEPQRSWTLSTLAQVAHMSRSNFSAQFSSVVGESPMQYVTRWRMQLASNWLLDDPELTLEQIAQQTGYTSVYAFSKAFKRIVGYAPSYYREKFLSSTTSKAQTNVP